MDCPQCGLPNQSGVIACAKCRTPLPFGPAGVTSPSGGSFLPKDADQTIANGAATGTSPATAAGARQARLSEVALQVGSVLGSRYEILQQLGEGGMGTVHKVYDRELERVVAMKVIRSELAQTVEVLNRFKQELIIARQVTHKNVSRIYDLAEADGVKFITMEFIEGRSLFHLLQQKGKLPPKQAAAIIVQVCRALEAAHAEGVIHRDLKPQNIILDERDRVVVMDFGIARSIQLGSMTQTGVVLGTPAYMSPEQAKGEELDARSDLFSVGIIFYELLTGDSPFKAQTTLEALYKRSTEPVRPPIEIVPEIPKPLSDIVVRCLEIDKAKRYASATEIVSDLEAWAGVPLGTREIAQRKMSRAERIGWIAVVAIALSVVGAFLFRDKLFSVHPVAHREVSVLVADFTNQTADSVFNETLEPAFIIGLEGAPFIRSFSRGTARKLAGQLSPNAKSLDEPAARLVATREGIDVIVVGSIANDGDQYPITVKAIDGITGKDIFSKSAKAEKKDVLASIGRLSADVRSALGDTTPESVKLAAQETFTAETLEAAHSYAAAQDLQQKGKWDEAIKEYQHATYLDPEFGRAFAGLAAMEANLGRKQEAERNYKLALAHIDRMTDREKYRTRGGYYLLIHDAPRAVEEYTSLFQQFPADAVADSGLAFAYFLNRNMDKAQEIGRHAADRNPAGVAQRANLALYALYAGDFASATKEAQAALKLNPQYDTAVRTLALAQLGQRQDSQATESYKSLAAISARGASMADTGLADQALYEGRTADAVHILEKAIAADMAADDKASAARKQVMLAEAQLGLGQKDSAVASADKAIEANKDDGIEFTAATVYIEAGKPALAKAIAAKLSKRLQPEPQIYAKLIGGQLQLHQGNAQSAVQAFGDAQKLSDTWLGRFYLGRAYLEAGDFAQALSSFEACQQRRGEATSVFLDDEPSYHDFPPVLYYLGRAQEGLHNGAATDSYKAFLAIKDKGDADPLVVDARRRLGESNNSRIVLHSLSLGLG
jgi:tetratricopeptide (TPR) repeat protein/predicted Ser/Thr protein kinase